MQPDALEMVLERADLPDERSLLWGADEVLLWPKGLLDVFRSTGIIGESSPATAIACDACDDGHWETPVIIEEPPGSSRRAYITCPESGRVPIDLARLAEWRFDHDALAETLARLLRTGPVTVTTHERLWRLGMLSAGGVRWTAFLVRGLGWSGPDVTEAVRRLRAPLLFSLGRQETAAHASVVPLRSVVDVEDAAIELDWPALEERASALSPSPSLSVSTTGQRERRRGRRPGLGFGPMLDCWTNCYRLDKAFLSRSDYYEAVARHLDKHPEAGITVPSTAAFSKALSRAASERVTPERCRWPRHDHPPSL